MRKRIEEAHQSVKKKLSYAKILNLVTRNQSDKLKDVGESVSRVKRTAKGALLMELNRGNDKPHKHVAGTSRCPMVTKSSEKVSQSSHA